MRLPSVPCSCSARIETGTSARSSTPSVRTPRDRSQSRSAPVTTARTTSLTVVENIDLTSLKSCRRARAPTSRRCGPISTLSGVAGAGFSPAQTTSPSPSAASTAAPTARSGCVSAPIALVATRSPLRTRSRAPAAVAGDAVQPAAQRVGDLLERRWRPLEDRHGPDVHVRDGALLVQERGVYRRQAVEVLLGGHAVRLLIDVGLAAGAPRP